MVGYGTNPPTHVHHRGASCADGAPCALDSASPNPHVLEGALVGGPLGNDTWADVRADFVKDEVALDYNAAFSGVLAMLVTHGDTWEACLAVEGVGAVRDAAARNGG